MEDFEKQMSGDVLIEKVNLLRATIVEVSIIKKRLFEYIHLSKKKIIVDISKCNFIDSTFLGAMVVSLKRTRKTGGDIKMVITSPFAKTLNISGFLRIFENYSSVEDAIKSFGLYSKEAKLEFINHRDLVFI